MGEGGGSCLLAPSPLGGAMGRADSSDAGPAGAARRPPPKVFYRQDAPLPGSRRGPAPAVAGRIIGKMGAFLIKSEPPAVPRRLAERPIQHPVDVSIALSPRPGYRAGYLVAGGHPAPSLMAVGTGGVNRCGGRGTGRRFSTQTVPRSQARKPGPGTPRPSVLTIILPGPVSLDVGPARVPGL